MANADVINNWINDADLVYGSLVDEESKYLFNLLFDYMAHRDYEDYCSKIYRHYNDWKLCEGLLDPKDEKPIVICGYGVFGQRSSILMRIKGYKIACITDKQKRGNVNGIEIMSIADATNKFNDVKYLVATNQYQDEIQKELIENGVKPEQIVIPDCGCYIETRGNQYFDLFDSKESEFFVDAGTFDGSTIRDFRIWTGDNFKRAIGMEPIEGNFILAEKMFQSDERVKIFQDAAWNKKEELKFNESGPGSKLSDEGGMVVQAISIDELAEKYDDPVTFIKMDIEGSELKALEGAKKTILKDFPRLAICIYHKPWDFIEIGKYILGLNSSYKLYIRHYTNCTWETVMYAVLDS